MSKRKIGFPMEFTPENLRGFIMLSKEDLSKAIVSKLTASQLKLWLYLMMIDSFADKTRDGERIYKKIPSPQEIAIQIGLSYYTVIKDISRLRKLKLYDYRVTEWQGYNCSAQKAKEKSDDLKNVAKNTTTQQNSLHKPKGSLNNLKEKKIEEAETVTGYGFCLFNQSGCLFSQSGCLNNQSHCLNSQSGCLFKQKLFLETSQGKGFSVPQTIQTNQTFSYSPDRETQENEIQLHNQINNNNQEVQQYSESLPKSNQECSVNTINPQKEEIFPGGSINERRLVPLNEIITNQLQKPLRSNNPQSINWQWLPDGTWKTEEGKLDPNFHEWLAKKWMQKYGTSDIFEAKANVLSYFRNDPCKLPIRWEQYHQEYLAKTQNIKLRLDNDCQISSEQQQQTIARISAVNPVSPEQSVSSEVQSNPSVAYQELEGEIIEPVQSDKSIQAEDEYGWTVRYKDFTGCAERQKEEEISVNPLMKAMTEDFISLMSGKPINRPIPERIEVLNFALSRESGRNKFFFAQAHHFANQGWKVDFNSDGEPIYIHQREL